MRIYLDTNLWNISCDQKVKPEQLLERLDRFGCTPVLGIHVVFELLKNLRNGSERGKERSKELFSHLHGYLSAGLRCVAKDVYDCITAEMNSMKGVMGAEKFIDVQSLQNLTDEISRLANGQVKSEWLSHIEHQIQAAAADRQRQQEHIANNPGIADRLRSVNISDFPAWLRGECKSGLGRKVLTERLCAYFPEAPTSEISEWATALVMSESRMASALVRAEIYYNWRCAHRNSNPRDLLDDMYHVLNAAYCDIYVTSEAKQADYFDLLLGTSADLCIFPASGIFADWIVGLARKRV